MLSFDARTRVYIAAELLDFRKQTDGLALAVQGTMLDTFSAHRFSNLADCIGWGNPAISCRLTLCLGSAY